MAKLNPWILLGLANEGMNHALGDLSKSTNITSPSDSKNIPDDDSTLQNVFLGIKAFLPIVTIFIGFIANYLMEYVLENVIFTLASVEAPVPGGVDSETLGSEKRGLLDDDEQTKRPVMKNAKPHYVTSSIRATLRHLSAEAGDLSFFRGIGAQTTINCFMLPIGLSTEWLVRKFITKNQHFSQGIAGLVVMLVLAQSVAACVHMVISKPRNKFWFRRLPLSWLRVAYIMSASFVSIAVTEEAISYIFEKLSPNKPNPNNNNNNKSNNTNVGNDQDTGLIRLSSGPVVPLPFFTLFFILAKAALRSQIRPLINLLTLAPLNVIHLRQQASMLPDTDDPIIPMDRQFASQPQTGIYTPSSNPLSFLSACKTFDKATFLRLFTLDLKLRCIKNLCTWSFWGLVFAEVVWLVGPASVTVVLKMVLGTEVTRGEFDLLEGSSRSIVGKMVQWPKGNSTVGREIFTAVLQGGAEITMTAPARP